MSAETPRPVVVASVPAGHPYIVSAIGRPGMSEDGLMVLEDVIPGNRPPGQWWPPLVLEPRTLGRWLDDGGGGGAGQQFDLVHVHFGFEGVPLCDLEECVRLLRQHHVPLVVTVHDLRNPHVVDDRDYAPRLDLLVRNADAVITLTAAAADEIRRRWNRRAEVIPHPHVAPLDRIVPFTTGMTAGPLRVALSLKSLRPNTLTAAQVRQVADTATSFGAHLRVSLHREAMDPAFLRHDPAMDDVLRGLSRHSPGRVDVCYRDRLDDDAFLADLADCDAVVLPYRVGTHSGVLEACRDVGTIAIAPEFGCYTSQAPCPTYDPDNIAETLPKALTAAERARGPAGLSGSAKCDPDGMIRTWWVDRASRREQAEFVREAHRRVYAAVLTATLLGAR